LLLAKEPHKKTLGCPPEAETKAHDSIGCEAGETFGLEAELMVSGLKEVRKTIKAVEAKNHEVCSRFSEYKYLLSIPGFGPDVASKVLGVRRGGATRFVLQTENRF